MFLQLFLPFFSLQNSLHCLLVASRFMFYTQESRHHIMIDFSLNPQREWCENSEIINKPFDSFNVRCWTERLFETFSPFFNRFHQICFLRFFKRIGQQGERRNELGIVWLQFTPEIRFSENASAAFSLIAPLRSGRISWFSLFISNEIQCFLQQKVLVV